MLQEQNISLKIIQLSLKINIWIKTKDDTIAHKKMSPKLNENYLNYF